MTPVLEPTFIFPLEAPPDAMPGGRIADPGLMFAGSPPMLYVAEPVWNATWGRWFSWHCPTIAGSVLLATLLATVWWIRRVGKRPRQVGRMYCRVCNHQLAKPQLKLNEKKRAVWADAESKCPECGVRHKRGPVRGRLRSTRLLPVLFVSPVVLFGCLLVMLAMLRFHQRSAWGGGTWPVAGMEKVFGAWALERRVPEMLVQSTRLWRIDPSTGAKEVVGPIDSQDMSFAEFITPDGKFAVAAEKNHGRVLVIDLKSGERRVYPSMPDTRSYFRIIRFAKDTNCAFVSRLTYLGPNVRHELLTFDPSTGEFLVIASVELSAEGRAPVFARSFEFRETTAGVAWVHKSVIQLTTGGREETLHWSVNGKQMERVHSLSSGSLRIELNVDGKACIVRNGMTNTTTAFDLATGDDLAVVPPIGEPQERDRTGPRLLGYSIHGVAEVMSLKGEPRTVGRLSAATQMSPVIGTADGRFASGWKEREVAPSWISAMLGVPPTTAPVVQVWDFEKLLDPETEKPLNVGK
ncbi:MAG: hypothetical protein KF805_00040 [Phycisphaeraceae bacterium]|nr:hypothetical protein [Phycisphaeraceae bacterium]